MASNYLAAGALISDDELYRYSLMRVWDEALPRLGWCALNPSTADGTKDDNSVRKMVKFSQRWGYGSLELVNAFALRSRNPKWLAAVPDPVGPLNLQYVRAVSQAVPLIACWGSSFPKDTTEHLQALGQFLRSDGNCFVLGLTQDGHPRHPLYMRDDTDPVGWETLL